MREDIVDAGGAFNGLKRAREKPALSDAERARHAAANAVAEHHGAPLPYPDLDLYPSKEDKS